MASKQANYKKPKNTKAALKNLFGYLGRHKFALICVALLVVISSGANIMGTYLLKPIINNYIIPKDIKGLVIALLLMGAMYLCGVAATWGYNRLMVHVSQKVISEIRSELFKKVQKLPLPYFDAHTHGELMSRFTNDVDTLNDALNNSFSMLIQSAIMVSGTIAMLLVLNIPLSFIVIGFLLIMTLFIRFNGKRSKKYFTKQQENLQDINGFVEEMVSGQKVVKIFNHEKKNVEEFSKLNENFRQSATKAMFYAGTTVPTIVSLSYINYAVSACVGGMFAIAGFMDLGGLASYLVYVRQSAMPLNQFTQQINFILSALSGAERIFEMMAEEPEIDDGRVTLCNVNIKDGNMEECSEVTGSYAWKCPDRSLIPLKGDVRFNEVTFGYNKKRHVLEKISLYAKPGQKIAFVGSTGAGKTTIINLINRFYEIESGSITYDGIDIRDISKKDLRKSLCMIIQDTHLFTGTIYDNIRYGRLSATDEEVEKAAEAAGAAAFIKRLPDGYNTMLDGDGSNLSGGQRQLLAIARAAVSNPPVLIMDEATSSVDTRTEKLIEKGMDALMEGRTVFVIAHRLSTVMNAKAIMVLEKGKIIERGSHDELIAQKGRYYELYTGLDELE